MQTSLLYDNSHIHQHLEHHKVSCHLVCPLASSLGGVTESDLLDLSTIELALYLYSSLSQTVCTSPQDVNNIFFV